VGVEGGALLSEPEPPQAVSNVNGTKNHTNTSTLHFILTPRKIQHCRPRTYTLLGTISECYF